MRIRANKAESTTEATSRVTDLVRAVQKSVGDASGSINLTRNAVIDTESKSKAASLEIDTTVQGLENIRTSQCRSRGEDHDKSHRHSTMSDATAQTVASSSKATASAGERQQLSANQLGEAERRLHSIIETLQEAIDESVRKTAA